MIFILIEWLRGWILPWPFWLKDLGQRGEYLVRRHYHRRGYFCLQRNWRHGKGEVDLIMANFQRVVFVEVKSRTEHSDLRIGNVLGKEQAKRLLRLANHYLAGYPEQDIAWDFRLALVAVEGRRFQIEETDLAPFAELGPRKS